MGEIHVDNGFVLWSTERDVCSDLLIETSQGEQVVPTFPGIDQAHADYVLLLMDVGGVLATDSWRSK
jgi:hypothetical protein